MSREIKFRFWNRDQKKFYYANSLESVGLIGKEAGGIPLNWMDAQQYTGFLDKNGKEIYEGDIFKGFRPIEFHNGRFITVLMGARIFELYEFFERGSKPEVVGNLMENPELLK